MIKKENLIQEFSNAIASNNGIFFIGSGISVPSGLPDWENLLKGFAEELNLKIEKNDDLAAIAQYFVNECSGNKGRLISKIIERVSSKYPINNYHKIISKMNIKTIWTTNYDCLIENAFSQNNIETEIQVIDDDYIKSYNKNNVKIIKMHGCIKRNPRDIIITKEDYEDYFVNRSGIATQLENDLLQNSVLFLGYSLSDENLKNILLRIRRILNRMTTTHYLIVKKDIERSEIQELWCKDLKRFGVETLIINEYKEIEDVLSKILSISRGNNLYITGSHTNTENEFAKDLGAKLAELNNLCVFDGQSTGITRTFIQSYSQKCLELKLEIHDRLRLFPNPYAVNTAYTDDIQYLPDLKLWRTEIFRQCKILLLFDGSLGTEAELQLAIYYQTIIVPIPLKNKEGLAYITLKKLQSDMPNLLPSAEYITKAEQLTLTVQDVFSCIKNLIEA